jgi:hypothetical protein
LPALPDAVCETDDAIFVIAGKDQVQHLVEAQRLMELPRQRGEALQVIGAAEVMLAPESKLVGKTLAELEFH